MKRDLDKKLTLAGSAVKRPKRVKERPVKETHTHEYRPVKETCTHEKKPAKETYSHIPGIECGQWQLQTCVRESKRGRECVRVCVECMRSACWAWLVRVSCACVHACVCVSARAHARVCVCVCVRARARVCVRVCVLQCVCRFYI